MAVRKIAHPSIDDRKAMGLKARDRAPLSGHAGWSPAADRPDPVALLVEQDADREQDLVPVRHGRMMVSPFTFYRGGAKIMAADLKDTPVAGLDAQLCGDAHLSNFGLFASPLRILLFDVNDFDETLPGPFEYDVKRMAASFTIAGRNNGFSQADTRAATLASVTAYREAMASFAQMGTMDIWYAHLDEDELMTGMRNAVAGTLKQEMAAKKQEKADKRAEAPKSRRNGRRSRSRRIRKRRRRIQEGREADGEDPGRTAHTRDSLQALSKLWREGRRNVPDRQPAADPCPGARPGRYLRAVPGRVRPMIHDEFDAYRATLADDRRHLLEHYEIVDTARKVVGVGSVGMRAFIVLLQGRDAQDPLFLQIKEATASALEAYLPKSRYRQHGERGAQGSGRRRRPATLTSAGPRGGMCAATRPAPAPRHEGLGGSRRRDRAGLTLHARTCGWMLCGPTPDLGTRSLWPKYLGASDGVP